MIVDNLNQSAAQHIPGGYDPELYKIRHSLAHVMAQAVLELFPNAQIAIGPPIKDGFYYDFDPYIPRPRSPIFVAGHMLNTPGRSTPMPSDC